MSEKSTRQRLTALSLAVLAVASLAVPFLLVGAAPAAADHAGNDGSFSGETLHNEMAEVDNDTRALYVEVENGSDPVDVHIYENGTSVANNTLNATSGPNATDSWEYGGVDPVNHSEYRVKVFGPENSTLERTTVSRLTLVSGGGGGAISFGASGTSVGALGAAVVFLVLLGGVAVVSRR
jgi:hypothetical protein